MAKMIHSDDTLHCVQFFGQRIDCRADEVRLETGAIDKDGVQAFVDTLQKLVDWYATKGITPTP